MFKPKLIRSLRDLATERARQLCSPEKNYFIQLVDVFEEKILDDYIQEILIDENAYKVKPFLLEYCTTGGSIPFPFTVNGEKVNQIRRSPEYQYSFEVFSDAEKWLFLKNCDCVRLFEELDSAGLITFDEQ
jgi:hypothetical protein